MRGPSWGAADRDKMGTLRTLWAKTKASNWVNKPYTRGTTAWKVQQGASKVTRALTGGGASRASKVLKGVGGVTTVLSGALAGWEQYKKDSANPSMGEGRRSPVPGPRPSPRGSADTQEVGREPRWG